MTTKRCPICLKEKPVEDFPVRSKSIKRRQPYCRPCSRARNSELYSKNRFSYAIRDANQKDIKWTISKEDYNQLTSQPCTYCSFPLSKTGIGLDRINSDLEYTLENVVPCCKLCNLVKGNQFTKEEMIEIGSVIKKILEERVRLGKPMYVGGWKGRLLKYVESATSR